MPKMQGSENCKTLEELAGLFQDKMSTIQQCLQLRDSVSDPTVQTRVAKVEQVLTDLQVLLTLMRVEVTQRKKALGEVAEMKNTRVHLQEQIDHIMQNLPDRLPKQFRNEKRSATTISTPPVLGQLNNAVAESTEAASAKKTNPTAKKKKIHHLEYLTVIEFEAIPKYMKGRLTYEKVNTAVDDINKALTAKYTLLGTKRSAQTDFIKKKMVAYKEMETKDTKGVQFIDAQDLKDTSGWKMDRVCSSLITMVRHCGRIREIRGGGITRYAACVE